MNLRSGLRGSKYSDSRLSGGERRHMPSLPDSGVVGSELAKSRLLMLSRLVSALESRNRESKKVGSKLPAYTLDRWGGLIE